MSEAEFAEAHSLAPREVVSATPTTTVCAPPDRASIVNRLIARGMHTRGAPGDRFDVVAVIGEGVNGRVVAARDGDLDREVAVKFLKLQQPLSPDAIDGFVDEARLTAGLDHPNVPPIYDVDVDDSGSVYFTMKRIDGHSLGSMISDSTEVARHPAIATTNRVVSILVGVAHALTYAHHRGVIHQDVKPDNIMLGAFGETLLVDWGSAARLDDPARRIYGTPLYMSPEQARSEITDARSDIYALGATLFHALTLRFPTWHDNPEEFWRRKQEGEINALTDVERRTVAPALLAIALKAMAALPIDRYQKVADFASDLENYQTGLAVSAHRESLLARARRWHRSNGRMLWLTVLTLATVSALVGLLYGERLRSMAHWGLPLMTETFPGDSMPPEWTVVRGGFTVRDGCAISTGPSDNILLCNRLITSNVAIEYDCESLRGTAPGDLSLIYAKNFELDNGQLKKYDSPVYFLVGAFDNIQTKILGVNAQPLTISDRHPEPGQRHHVRMTIERDVLTISIDGVVTCETRYDSVPTSGRIALYSFYEGKAFSNVRIWSKGGAELVRATDVGDALMTQTPSNPQAAAVAYARVAEAHHGSEIGDEALWRQGVALSAADHQIAAEQSWARINHPWWRLRAEEQRLKKLFNDENHAATLLGMSALVDQGGDSAKRCAELWAELTSSIASPWKDQATIDLYQAFGRKHLLEFPIARHALAFNTCYAGRYEDVLRYDPQLIPNAPLSLLFLGRYEDVIADYPEPSSLVARALLRMGRLDEVTSRFPRYSTTCALALIDAGRAEQVLERFAEQPPLRALALCALGRLAEAAAIQNGDEGAERARRLLAAQIDATDDLGRAFTSAIAGDTTKFAAVRIPSNLDYDNDAYGMIALVIVPLIDRLLGLPDRSGISLERTVERHRLHFVQRPWHFAARLLGRIDKETFSRQPFQRHIAADTVLVDAMSADLAGEHRVAQNGYTAWLMMPRWRRDLGDDPNLVHFVEWRHLVCGRIDRVPEN